MVSFKFWKWAPKIKADDLVEYKGRFLKDGTFELEFEIEVPEVIWKVAVQKKFGRNPPPRVVVDERVLKNVDLGMLKGTLDKIAEDVRKKSGRDIRLYPSQIEKMIIRMVGPHKYKAWVKVVGVWAE